MAEKSGNTSPEWEVVEEESPSVVIFDTIGDQFTGTYAGLHEIAPDDGEPFSRFSFRGEDGELYDLNSSYNLRQAMMNVTPGDLCRITYIKDIPTKRGLNPLKDYRVEVARMRFSENNPPGTTAKP